MPCQITFSTPQSGARYLIANATHGIAMSGAGDVVTPQQADVLSLFGLTTAEVQDVAVVDHLMKARPDLLVGLLD